MKVVTRNIARFIFAKLLPKRAYTVMKGPLKGKKFILGSLAGEGKGATVYFNMTEVEQTAMFVKYIKENDVIYDIGANVGYYSVLGSSLIGKKGRVFAFEPAARNIHYLYLHKEINNCKNISIIPLACADRNSLNVFSFGPNPAMGHLLSDFVQFSGENDTIVYSVTVDTFTEKFSLKPNVFKIDVEGAELEVLKGASDTIKKYMPFIFLSTHSEKLKKDCTDFLSNFGYEFEEIIKDEEPSLEILCKANKR